ncbi:PAC2 family protein [Bifidobacterium adolescentis]|uniref:PAC2 family protein n=1 Tax=Bifidobacterium adolescentis TaxID=1680 RepID=UPI001896B38D|nr:PAC2 family protein [Bifidobacterium adolescentis]
MCEESAMPRTILIAAFEGWNDASQAATNVVRHLVSRYESQEVRHIDNEGFYDYQVARPMICSVQGRKRIIWPQTTFYDIAVSPMLHLLAQIAPEPNYRWEEYCRQTLRVAEDYDVSDVITLGSMFDECPHTRPLPLDISKSGCECESDREYNGPVGIPNILDAFAAEAGFPTTFIWVSVPHYCANTECMQGTLELLRALSLIIEYPLIEGDLTRKAMQWRSDADGLVSDMHAGDYLARLEHDYDLDARAKRIASNGMPACEELLREAESLLRNGV